MAQVAMKPWSYPIILGVWLQNFYTSYVSWSHYPDMVTLPILIANYVVSLTIIGYFVVPTVRAVYYNPRLRWWEQKPRFVFELPCLVKVNEQNSDAMLLDLAEGGAYLTAKAKLKLNVSVQQTTQAIAKPVSPGQLSMAVGG